MPGTLIFQLRDDTMNFARMHVSIGACGTALALQCEAVFFILWKMNPRSLTISPGENISGGQHGNTNMASSRITQYNTETAGENIRHQQNEPE